METLQSLSESTKRKILVGATVLIMIVVVYFWLAYFNNLIAAISQPTVAQDTTGQSAPTTDETVQQSALAVQPASSTGDSFLGYIGGAFTGMIQGVEDIFKAPGQYNIQPHQ